MDPRNDPDPEALERAAVALEGVARSCKQQAAILSNAHSLFAPLAARTRSVIGGSASKADVQMQGHVAKGAKTSKAGSGELERAAVVANRLAAHARQRAREARGRQGT